MRDVSNKPDSLRSATAIAVLRAPAHALEAIASGSVPKGDVLATARIAGIQAAKRTADWLPFCHTLPLDYADIEAELGSDQIEFKARVRTVWKTGVEMEALAAASAAALTAYDMLKPITKELVISETRLLEKRGGKSQLNVSSVGVQGAVLVISDSVSRKEQLDRAGTLIQERMESLEMKVVSTKVVADEVDAIQEQVRAWIEQRIPIIMTTGGTGPGPRDVTPEALTPLLERPLPGVAEAARSYGQRRTPFSMMSRSVAGVAHKSFIVTLPGSPRAVDEYLDVLFPALLHVLPVLDGERHG